MANDVFQVDSHILIANANQLAINVPATITILIATALVLFMIPGLAIFYGGLVRKKNVATIIAQSFISMTIVGLIWIFGGFGLAFGPSFEGFIGDPSKYFLFRNILFKDWGPNPTLVVNATLAGGIPFIAFFLFQMSFAIITPALVTGAFADRLKYKGFILFTILFTLFIYIPVCHWIWGGGFLAANGTVDWAGGIVIHVTCGAAAIGSVVVLKKRSIGKNESTSPHSLPLVAIGAGILFFGWFGFNIGGASFIPISGDLNTIKNLVDGTGASGLIGDKGMQMLNIGMTTFANSFISMIIAILIWTIFDLLTKKQTSLLSILTAGVVGLATITPAAGFVPIWSAPIFGLLGGGICYWMAYTNHKIHFDDALEVWPTHGIGGIVGSILLSAFAMENINPFLLNMNLGQIGSATLLLWQFIAVLLIGVWTFAFSVLIFYIVLITGGKASAKEQKSGLDESLFHEDAYSIMLPPNTTSEQRDQLQSHIVEVIKEVKREKPKLPELPKKLEKELNSINAKSKLEHPKNRPHIPGSGIERVETTSNIKRKK